MDDAGDAGRGGRFQLECPKPLVGHVAQTLLAVFAGSDLRDQPGGDLLSVIDGGLAEAERLANLRTVIFNCAALPGVL
jgi:hypothetical protein